MGRLPGPTLACTRCTEAKRKCTKHYPSCGRCQSKGLVCQYLPAKPSTFIPLTTPDGSAQHLGSTSDQTSTARSSWVVVDAPPSGGPQDEISRSSSQEYSHKSQGWWFETPDTWLIDQAPGGIKRMPPSTFDLDNALQTVRAWLLRWTNGETNPLIHSVLYRHHMPSSIQDVYMAFGMYAHRTKGNLDLVHRIIGEKARDLVAIGGSADPDLLNHLARVQALLIYQTIGLQSGNNQLRYTCERNIPTLMEWTHDLVDRARQYPTFGQILISKNGLVSSAGGESWEQNVWYSWIVAESIRRTWLMVSMVQGIYLTSQDGIDHCLGGMMFTSRKGFWDTADALAWQQLCVEVHGGLIRLPDVHSLFARIDPPYLDEFAELVLQVTFGSEQMEKWLNQLDSDRRMLED